MDTKLLSRLQAQCVRREYCTKDIYEKALKALAKADGEREDAAGGFKNSARSQDGFEEAARQICDALAADGFVDDARYAAAFARDKSSLSGWGPVKITRALMAKGVSREIALSALSEIDSERSDERMETMLRNKYHSLKDDPQAKLKLLRFALGRGYTYDQVRDAVDAICREGSKG